MPNVALIQDTPMRSAFAAVLGSASSPLDGWIVRGLKTKAGRIFHRKGWYVTRRGR